MDATASTGARLPGCWPLGPAQRPVMPMSAQWELPSIPDLADWLFDGLYAVYNGKDYSDRKYALSPLELNDVDYPYLQIVRQVRTYDRRSLTRLRAANDEAITRWRTSF